MNLNETLQKIHMRVAAVSMHNPDMHFVEIPYNVGGKNKKLKVLTDHGYLKLQSIHDDIEKIDISEKTKK
jgi:hypothetical protein